MDKIVQNLLKKIEVINPLIHSYKIEKVVAREDLTLEFDIQKRLSIGYACKLEIIKKLHAELVNTM